MLVTDDPTLEFKEEYIFDNGAVYKGQWKNGNRHGYGI